MPASRGPLEVRCVLQGGRADAGREAELGVVGDAQRLLVVPDPHDRRDRAEDLLAVDAHPVVGLGEQCRLQIKAVGLAREPLAAEGELGPLVPADAEIAQVLIELGLIDHRADLGALLDGVVDHEMPHLVDHRVDEAVVDALAHDQPRGRRAALPGRVEGTLDGAR